MSSSLIHVIMILFLAGCCSAVAGPQGTVRAPLVFSSSPRFWPFVGLSRPENGRQDKAAFSKRCAAGITAAGTTTTREWGHSANLGGAWC